MCGIAGIVSFVRPPDAEEALVMARQLVHRGPDDEGVYAGGPAALAFRRLSIIDVAGGHQPMTVGPVGGVFNGEIYDFRELRSRLEGRGHLFRTRSDTEVLLAAYLEWGEAFLGHVEGMFAFAIWDPRRQRLVCGRDRFGEKPFYWARVGRTFLFGSELKALLAHPDCPRAIDPVQVRRYLAFDYVPAPGTIFAGVHKLPQGHLLTFDEGGVTERRFWRFPRSGGSKLSAFTSPRTVAEATQQVQRLLRQAVRRRLVSDVPLGVFLSGGIDSSAIAAFAAQEVSGLKTFSIGFEEASYDESGFARMAARAFSTDHHEERLSAKDCLELVPEAVDALDEPFADPSFLPMLLLARFARRQVTVSLGGDGADELFGGYETFFAHPFGVAFDRMPALARRALVVGVDRVPASAGYMSFGYKLRAFLAGAPFAPAYRHQAWIGTFTPGAMQKLLLPSWRSPGDPLHDVYGPLDAFEQGCAEEGLERALRGYLTLYLADDILVKVDRASMAASLEVRAPFLDTDLAEYVMRLPATFKVHGLDRKWLLKRALRGIVPDALIDRKKHGFPFPVSAWLRGPLRALVEEVLSERALRDGGIFEPAEVRALVEGHLSGRADHRKPLWTLLMFELWRQRWATRSVGAFRERTRSVG